MNARLDAALAEVAAAIQDHLRSELTQAAGAPQRLLSVGEAATLLGIGRSALYSEIGAGRLRSVKIGRRRLVPAQAIADRIAAGSDPS